MDCWANASDGANNGNDEQEKPDLGHARTSHKEGSEGQVFCLKATHGIRSVIAPQQIVAGPFRAIICQWCGQKIAWAEYEPIQTSVRHYAPRQKQIGSETS